MHYEHRSGPNYRPGLGLPLEYFTGDHRHLVAYQMHNLPTMMVLLAEHAAHCNVHLRM